MLEKFDFIISVSQIVVLLCLIFQVSNSTIAQQANHGLSLFALAAFQIEKRLAKKE